MAPRSLRIEAMTITALTVPLKDPFVIATGRIDTTRAALIELTLLDEGRHERWTGLGEAAALPPVTAEDQPDVMRSLGRFGEDVWSTLIPIEPDFAGLRALLDQHFVGKPVARAGAETAFLDAIARWRREPLRTMLGGTLGAATTTLTTDITIPIHEPSYMAKLAIEWRALGFRCFKVKVGKDRDADLRALEAIAKSVGDASFRLDANEGFTADEAIAVVREIERMGLSIDCFEQPCARDDLEGMARVTREIAAPVIADESVRSLSDLARVIASFAANGVNLKLAKSGGPLSALAIGRAARDMGLSLMCGGMVETRLGMTAAAHVAAALGGVDYVDLDTAWLLAEERFTGGYRASGPDYTLGEEHGLGIAQTNTSPPLR